MNVIVAGGTGFLGTALQRHLRNSGHDVRVFTRRRDIRPNELTWLPDGTVGSWAAALEQADVVINLSGAGIADARWTDARKQLLRDSRIRSTRSLARAIQQATRKPAMLINASGIGYYGDRGAELVTEDTPPGDDFLARVCVDWEAEAITAQDAARVVILRNAVVLDPSGGALGRMMLPFRLGLGGRLGSGAQYFAWIHLEDWLALVTEMITNTAAHGAFNATAPRPATNAEFTRALGRALHRPTIIPVPAFALRMALGELADALLTGQRAVPKRTQQLGFTFRFPEIEPALRDLM